MGMLSPRSIAFSALASFAAVSLNFALPTHANYRDADFMMRNARVYVGDLQRLCQDATRLNHGVAGNRDAKGFAIILYGWKLLGDITQQEHDRIYTYMQKNCRDGLVIPRSKF